jgi:hypothetical protein
VASTRYLIPFPRWDTPTIDVEVPCRSSTLSCCVVAGHILIPPSNLTYPHLIHLARMVRVEIQPDYSVLTLQSAAQVSKAVPVETQHEDMIVSVELLSGTSLTHH